MKDLYEVLNLRKDATSDDIKKSYRKLAFQCHPDKNKSPEARTHFREISEAYEILSHGSKKETYDRFGYEAASNQEAPINPLDLFQSLFNVDFSGHLNQNVFFFSDLSSGGLGDIPYHTMVHTLELTIDELYSGTQKEFEIPHTNEDGIIQRTKYVLNIKAGTQDKEYLSVKGGGNYNPQTRSHEDLRILIQETIHPLYRRQGHDLYREHTISLCDALCGPELVIDHFGETLRIEIQSLVRPNSLYQVVGQGMPLKKGAHAELTPDSESVPDFGNLIVDLKIEFPTYLTDTQKGYLQQILGSSPPEETEETETPHSGTLVEAHYFKDKDEVMKEYLQEDEETGCSLQ